MRLWSLSALACLTAFGGVAATVAATPMGVFTDHRDIGAPSLAGDASYDPGRREYRITAGGANMWAAHDDFHYMWRKASGDIAVDTRLDFVTPMPAPTAAGYLHRKGGIIIRQDLDPDSAYVDALRMGNEQMSLQYRERKGGPTRLIWVNTRRQQAVRLEKIGDYAYLSVQGADGKMHRAGGSFKIKLAGPYLVGLGVCPHDDTTRETMVFRNFRIAKPENAHPQAHSTLQTIQVANPLEQTAVVHGTTVDVDGWSEDGRAVYARKDGQLYRAVAWDSAEVVKVGNERPVGTHRAESSRPVRISGSLSSRRSPDGRSAAYLTQGAGRRDMILHVVPVENGTAQMGKDVVLSKFVGDAASLGARAWSPDGKLIAFVSAD